MAKADVVRNLREQLRKLEGSTRRLDEGVFSSGVDGLDRLLPAGGFRWGTLWEWISAGDGAGAATLSLVISGHLLRDTTGAFLAIDPAGELYPPAAAGLGIPLERTVLVRPKTPHETLWTLEQGLRSRGATVVFGALDRLDDRAFRRLQLACEVGRGIGFLLRPKSRQSEPSWAEGRLLVEPKPAGTEARGRRLRVTLLQSREGTGRGAVELEVDDETNDVRLVPRVVDATAAPREASG